MAIKLVSNIGNRAATDHNGRLLFTGGISIITTDHMYQISKYMHWITKKMALRYTTPIKANSVVLCRKKESLEVVTE